MKQICIADRVFSDPDWRLPTTTSTTIARTSATARRLSTSSTLQACSTLAAADCLSMPATRQSNGPLGSVLVSLSSVEEFREQIHRLLGLGMQSARWVNFEAGAQLLGPELRHFDGMAGIDSVRDNEDLG